MNKFLICTVACVGLALGFFYAKSKSRMYSPIGHRPSTFFVSKPHLPLRAQLNLVKISSNTYKLTPVVQFFEDYEQPDRKIHLKYHLPNEVTVISGELNTWLELGSSNVPQLIIEKKGRAKDQDCVIILDAQLGSFSNSTAVALSESLTDQESREEHPFSISQSKIQSKTLLDGENYESEAPKKNRFISSELNLRQ